MTSLFRDCESFNQDIGGWTTTALTDMRAMFENTAFNYSLNSWDVSNVTDFRDCFWDADAYNQPMDSWNTSSATNMGGMFYFANVFDQDISNFDMTGVTNLVNMFGGGSGLSTANYDALLIGWEAQVLKSNETFHAGTSEYSAGAAATARQSIIDTYNWTINDSGQENLMSTLSKNWITAVELAKTAKFGGSDAVVAADREYDYTSDVDLETAGYQGAQVLVEMELNFGARVVIGAPAVPNDLIVDVFASLDGTIYDTIPYKSFNIKASVERNRQIFSFIVLELAHFRIGLKVDGKDDTYDYRITYQPWNTDDS
jgi:hypothetical protein